MSSQTCDVKGCLDNIDQVLIVHHCKYMKLENLICRVDPYKDNEDRLHCIIRFCDRHAAKYRKQLQAGNLEKSEIQFKDSIHRHR